MLAPSLHIESTDSTIKKCVCVCVGGMNVYMCVFVGGAWVCVDNGLSVSLQLRTSKYDGQGSLEEVVVKGLVVRRQRLGL